VLHKLLLPAVDLGRWRRRLRHLGRAGGGRSARPRRLRRQRSIGRRTGYAPAGTGRPPLRLNHARLRTYRVELRMSGATGRVLRRVARMALRAHHRRPLRYLSHLRRHLTAWETTRVVHSWTHFLARCWPRRPDEAARRRPHVWLRRAMSGRALRRDVLLRVSLHRHTARRTSQVGGHRVNWTRHSSAWAERVLLLQEQKVQSNHGGHMLCSSNGVESN
jgi:hypothetical protein